MFAGHLGVALAAARAEPRLNLGLLAAASLLLDLLLWAFILLGWESVTIPADFALTHQPEFVFPYSHSLMASVVWAALAGAWVMLRRGCLGAGAWRAALLVAAAVCLHWLADALVHRPGLPLAGAASPRVGLGLWDHMPAALAIEATLVLLGMGLFLPRAGLSRWKALALGGLCLLVLGFTAAGMTVAPPPPSPAAMAASSLVTIVVVCILMGWLGRPSRARRVA